MRVTRCRTHKSTGLPTVWGWNRR